MKRIGYKSYIESKYEDWQDKLTIEALKRMSELTKTTRKFIKVLYTFTEGFTYVNEEVW